MRAVLDDWHTAPVDDRLGAMLGFLEKLTLDPASLTAADVARLHAADLTDDAIEDAIHVCALFNIYDRMADALSFDIPGADAFASSAAFLLKRGYA